MLGLEKDSARLNRRNSPLTVTVSPNSTWTNETLEQEVCNALLDSPYGLTIAASEAGNSATLKFALPTCLIELGYNLTSLSLSNVLINSFDEIPDQLESLEVQNSILLGNLSSEWYDTLFPRFSLLKTLNLTRCGLTGSLPSDIPFGISTFALPHNAIAGTIDSSFFRFYSDQPVVLIDLEDNLISGSLPTGIFSDFSVDDENTVVVRVVSLASNKLTGTIPANLISDITSPGDVFVALYASNNFFESFFMPLEPPTNSSSPSNESPDDESPIIYHEHLVSNVNVRKLGLAFDFDSCGLSGPLPEATLAGIIVSALNGEGSSFSFSAAHNSLSGPTPRSIFSESEGKFESVSLKLNDNALTGTIVPLILPEATYNIAFDTVIIDLSDNAIDETISNSIFLLTGPYATTIVLDVSNNSLHGQIPESFLTSDFNPSQSHTGLTFEENFSDRSISLLMRQNLLSGTFPGSFFSYYNFSSIYLDVSSNSIGGTIETNFFGQNLTSHPLKSVTLLAHQNLLSGEVPSDLLAATHTPRLQSLWIDFSENFLSGTIPALFEFVSNATLRISSNQLSGSIPENLFLIAENVTFVADNNQKINGSLPNDLCFSSNNVSLSISNTSLSGGLSSTYWSDCNWVAINLANNDFSGDVPSAVITAVKVNIGPSKRDKTYSEERREGEAEQISSPTNLAYPKPGTINLSNNRFTSWSRYIYAGTVPPKINALDISGNLISFLPPASELNALIVSSLSISNNPLSGPLPLSSSRIAAMRLLDVSGCGFEGNLPDLPAASFSSLPSNQMPPVSLHLGNNRFEGPIPTSWTPYTIHSLDISNNPNVFGNLSFSPSVVPYENALSSDNIAIPRLWTFNTAISGSMVNLGRGYQPQKIDLRMQGTQIDFCAPPSYDPLSNLPPSSQLQRISWNYPNENLVDCDMRDTNVCNCRNMYPSKCSAHCDYVQPNTPQPSTISPLNPNSPGQTSPGPLPNAQNPSNFPQNPNVAPTGQSSPPGMRCELSARPSSQFECINGIWTSLTSVVGEYLKIPANAAKVLIRGDLGCRKVVFRGADSTIIVEGKATNISIVELDIDDIEKIPENGKSQELIAAFASAGSTLERTDLKLRQNSKKSGCKKLQAEKDQKSTSTKLVAVFSFNTKACDTWWIVLLSISIFIIVLIVIGAIIILKVPRIRNRLLPYRGSSAKFRSPTLLNM